MGDGNAERLGLKRTKTEIGGVLLLDNAGGERVTVLVENHAVVLDMPQGWNATYYAPNDVKAREVRLQLAQRRV